MYAITIDDFPPDRLAAMVHWRNDPVVNRYRELPRSSAALGPQRARQSPAVALLGLAFYLRP